MSILTDMKTLLSYGYRHPSRRVRGFGHDFVLERPNGSILTERQFHAEVMHLLERYDDAVERGCVVTPADRLAEAVEDAFETHFIAAVGSDDRAEMWRHLNQMHDIVRKAIHAHRSAPPVDIDALVEDLLYEITPDHAVTPERRKRVRAVLREAGVIE